ncbi:MAG: hypothetical protein ABFD90_15915 [Phycisphaerales bacterium]
MMNTAQYVRRTNTATTLRDFVIQGAAELDGCEGAQSFRAARRNDGMPVLLHKFRPAASLTALGPVIEGREPPDFGRPFLTRFTDFFAVAGSAYLVEPLPPCSGLTDVWRHVLQKRPGQTIAVMTVLLRQMIAITHQLACQSDYHGAIDVRNVVLAPTGCFGVLTAHMECEGGRLWLRRNPTSPMRSDAHGLVDILGSLLDLDAEVAVLQKMPVQIPMNIHRKVRRLLHALRRMQSGLERHVRS